MCGVRVQVPVCGAACVWGRQVCVAGFSPVQCVQVNVVLGVEVRGW